MPRNLCMNAQISEHVLESRGPICIYFCFFLSEISFKRKCDYSCVKLFSFGLYSLLKICDAASFVPADCVYE